MDFKNEVFTILPQIIGRLHLRCDMPEANFERVKEVAKDRAAVCRTELQLSEDEGKELLISMSGLISSTVFSSLSSNEIIL